MTDKPTVVFDVDGVFCDFVAGYTQLAHELFGTPVYPTGAQRTWGFTGTTPEQDAQLWEYIKASPTFWLTMDPLVNLPEVNMMHEFAGEHHIVYMTNRVGLHPGRQTREWLMTNGLPQGDIEVVRDKAEAIASGYPDVRAIIEDSPSNIEVMLDKRLPVYVRDWPYNRVLSWSAPIAPGRVSSVAEFLDRVWSR